MSRLVSQIGRSFSDRLDSDVDLVSVQAAQRHGGAGGKSGTAGVIEGSRFYFHIENGNRYPDETGSVFSTSDGAAAHAFVIAQELAPDKSWHGSAVLVTDDRGQEIVRVPIG
jgi:hypothetical protein